MAHLGRAAALAARKLAASPAGRRAIEAAAEAVANAVGQAGAGGSPGRRPRARSGSWPASSPGRSTGQLSEAVFIGSPQEHWVVWKDGVPLAAFPPVDGDLASKAELRHVTDDDRFDPPPAPRGGRAAGLGDRLPRPGRRS
jgi:hypothetical protein